MTLIEPKEHHDDGIHSTLTIQIWMEKQVAQFKERDDGDKHGGLNTRLESSFRIFQNIFKYCEKEELDTLDSLNRLMGDRRECEKY